MGAFNTGIEIVCVIRRTQGQRGIFTGKEEYPLFLWYAEARHLDIVRCGEGMTEDLARKDAIFRVQEFLDRR